MQTTTMLFSRELPPPNLSFDYAIQTHVGPLAFEGFRRWGPYDKNQPRLTSLKCAILYPSYAVQEMRKVREAIQRGMHFFRGFQHFSHGVSLLGFDPIQVNVTANLPLPMQARAYHDVIEAVGEKSEWDLVIALIPYSPRYVIDSPYYIAKLELAARGVPCQLLTIQKLQNDETFKWSLANIALQVYAKLGNIPWVVKTPDKPADLIIGVGQRKIRSGRIGEMKRFMGFTTAYKNNGAFLTFQGIAVSGTDDDYLDQLSSSVTTAIKAYRESQEKRGQVPADPDRIILHSFKKVGEHEIEALERGIQAASQNGNLINYALIHIDGSSNFLAFDHDHKTFLPSSGYTVSLGPLQALLVTEGRERYDHRKVGFPTPLVIRLDPRSKLSSDDLPNLFAGFAEQVYALSKVNWRGFNAAAVPVTLGYSRLIADLISSCSNTDTWTKISTANNLRNKAWFL